MEVLADGRAPNPVITPLKMVGKSLSRPGTWVAMSSSATLLRVPQGPQVAVVVLGAANSTTRFWEARHLFNWVVGRWTGIAGGDFVPETVGAELIQ